MFKHSHDVARIPRPTPFAGYGLAVCDASVFPSSVTMNPQLTVMALADYAAAGIE
jgi:hypothetical protein